MISASDTDIVSKMRSSDKGERIFFMIRAATWAAVSSAQQAKDDKVSLDVQAQACKVKAIDLGATVTHELTIPGKSRNIVLFEDACNEIEAYAQLRELVKSKSIDLLLFYTKSRLGRTLALCETIVAFCQTQGVAVYDLAAPPSSIDAKKQRRSSGDVLISAVTSATAQNDNSQRTVAHESGMIGRVQSGEMANNIPFGWRKVYSEDGKYRLVIDELAASGIRRAYELYLSGHGLREVVIAVNKEGHKAATGQPWTRSSARNIIDKVWVYAGYVEINRESPSNRPYTKAKGRHPAIISEETAQQVVIERTERIKARRAVNTPYLFSRVLVCGLCGRNMSNDTNAGSYVTVAGERRTTYRALKCERCNRYVSVNIVKRAFENYFTHISENYVADVDDQGSSTTEGEKRLVQMETQLKEIEQKAARAHTAYVDGLMDYKVYTAQTKRLATEKRDLEDQINIASSRIAALRTRKARREELPAIAEIGIAMLKHSNQTEANAWLRTFFRATFTENREIRIELI